MWGATATLVTLSNVNEKPPPRCLSWIFNEFCSRSSSGYIFRPNFHQFNFTSSGLMDNTLRPRSLSQECGQFFSSRGLHYSSKGYEVHVQPLDVYFFRQYKRFIRRLQDEIRWIMGDGAIRKLNNRVSIMKMHSFIYNQLMSWDIEKCYCMHGKRSDIHLMYQSIGLKMYYRSILEIL